MYPRFWLLCYPDVSKPIGGVKQLHRVCEFLASLGYESILVQEDKSFSPSWFSSCVNTISRHDWISRDDIQPDTDVIILPETFLPAIDTFFPAVNKIIFNQNSSYTFGLPANNVSDISQTFRFYHHPRVVQVWCVSSYDFDFLSCVFGLDNSKLFKIINGLGPSDSFAQSQPKKRQIAYMPRKNIKEAHIVTNLISAHPALKRWSLVPIQDCSHDDVLAIFHKSLLFLSFGHPEGFGLPLAEAMACGCGVVGYSGLGGRELFNSKLSNIVNTEIEFGDRFGFLKGILSFQAQLLYSPSSLLENLHTHALTIQSTYSDKQMKDSLSNALDSLLLIFDD